MKDIPVQEYPFLVNSIIKYIEEVKKYDNDISFVEIIIDYCFRNEIELEAAGDAISSDVYFKSFIEKNCELNKIFKSNINVEEW